MLRLRVPGRRAAARVRLALIAATLLYPVGALAAPHDGSPKLLLHRLGVTAKNVCGRAALGDCRDAATAAGVGDPSFVYVIGARGSLPSLGAVEFGLYYQGGDPNGASDGVGLDIHSWTRCATLDYPSPGPRAWPAPGGGNLIVFDGVLACPPGETAVLGFFYVTAYSPDALHLVPRPSTDQASMADCASVVTRLAASDLGSIAFSAGAIADGCNPCAGPCPESPAFPPAVCELTVETNTEFPTVRVNDGNHHRRITLRNSGGQRMAGRLVLSSNQFRMWGEHDRYDLRPFESADYWVTFQPSEVGDHTAVLTIGSGCPTLTFTGRAVPYSECQIGPNVHFAETQVGSSREAHFSVRNPGPGFVSGSLLLDGCSGDFTLVGDPNFALAVGQEHFLKLRFAPTRVEEQTCRIRSTTFCNVASVVGRGYIGEPVPPICRLKRDAEDFGTIIVGQVRSGSIPVTNAGGGILRLPIAPDLPFRWHSAFPARVELHAGQTGIVRLEFAPTAPGEFVSELRMGDCPPVTLTGTARLPGAGVLSPNQIDFGVVPEGDVVERTFSVTNGGTGRISGTMTSPVPEFTLVGGDGYDLGPGETASFQVRFSSPAVGEFSGYVDAGTNSSILPLTAMVEPATPVRSATWSAIKSRFGRTTASTQR